MMSFTDGIIPVRFALMSAYTIITIVALYSRDPNVLACLPDHYSNEEYYNKDLSLKIGYFAALGLVIFELAGFMSGISTFMPMATLAYLDLTVAILTHGVASIMMACYLMFEWSCGFYWWIFFLGSIIPTLMEIFSLISILFLWSAWGISRLRRSMS